MGVETWTKTCGLPLLANFEPHPNDVGLRNPRVSVGLFGCVCVCVCLGGWVGGWERWVGKAGGKGGKGRWEKWERWGLGGWVSVCVCVCLVKFGSCSGLVARTTRRKTNICVGSPKFDTYPFVRVWGLLFQVSPPRFTLRGCLPCLPRTGLVDNT